MYPSLSPHPPQKKNKKRLYMTFIAFSDYLRVFLCACVQDVLRAVLLFICTPHLILQLPRVIDTFLYNALSSLWCWMFCLLLLENNAFAF